MDTIIGANNNERTRDFKDPITPVHTVVLARNTAWKRAGLVSNLTQDLQWIEIFQQEYLMYFQQRKMKKRRKVLSSMILYDLSIPQKGNKSVSILFFYFCEILILYQGIYWTFKSILDQSEILHLHLSTKHFYVRKNVNLRIKSNFEWNTQGFISEGIR